MALALLVQAVLMTALVAGLVWLATLDAESWQGAAFFVLIAGAGATTAATRAGRFRRRAGVRKAMPQDNRKVERLLTRLCLAGGLDVPSAKVHADLPPLAWTDGVIRRRPTVHVTTGLLDALAPAELEAALAHELGHLAHNDAAVMTILSGPPRWFIAGVFSVARDGFRGFLAAVVIAPFLLPLPLLLSVSGLIVSRHRELAADRTAALLTGSPAAVAAAIIACRDAFEGMDRAYWRGLEKHDAEHFAQIRPAEGIRLLWAAQPRERTRLRHLEAMEAKLQRPER